MDTTGETVTPKIRRGPVHEGRAKSELERGERHEIRNVLLQLKRTKET